MGRVFITQQPKPNHVGWMPNLSPAMQFGRFVYVFSSDSAPWTNPDEAIETAAAALAKFDPEEDYLLYPNSGDPAAMWIILLVLARFSISKLKILYWERKLVDGERSRKDGFYSPITIKLPLF
jgi:hypothetical protein